MKTDNLVQMNWCVWRHAMPFVAFLVSVATVGVAQAETSARDGAVTATTPYCRDQQAPASTGLVDPYFDASIGTTWDDNTTALWSTSGTEGTFNQTWSAAGGGIGALATFQGTAGTVSLSGGVSVGAITFGVSGYTLGGSGSLTLANSGTVTIGSGSGAITALIAGGGVVKEGGGTLTLNKLNNTYSGGTTVNAGSLVGIAGTGAGGTIAPFGAGALSISSGATVTVDNSSAGNYNYYGGGAISGSGTIVFIGNGVNRLIVDSVNFSGFTGTITIGGTGQPVELDGAGANTTAAMTINSGAVLYSRYGATYGALLGSGFIRGLVSASTVTIGNGGGNGTFSGVIENSGNVISLTKIGSGTQVLSGNNTYTGRTTINGGILNLGSSGALGGGGSITFTGGTLQFTSSNTMDYSSRIKNSTGLITLDTNGQNVTFSSVIDTTNTGGLAKVGTGTLTLGGANSYTGGTTLSAGILDVGTTSALGNSSGTLTVNGGTLQLNNYAVDVGALNGSGGTIDTGTGALTTTLTGSQTFGGTIINAGSLNTAGTGTLTLTGNNAYTGATTINAGTLIVANSSGTGLAAGSSVSVSGGTLLVNNSGGVGVAGPVTVSSGTLGGTGTFTGSVSINSGGHVSPGNGGIGTINAGSLTLASGSYLDFDITNPSTLDQVILSPSSSLVINGGTVTINGGSSPFTTVGSYNLIQYTSAGGAIGGTGTLSLNSANMDPLRSYSFTSTLISGNNYWLTLDVAILGTTYEWYGYGFNGTIDNNWDTSNNWSPSGPITEASIVNFGAGSSSGTLNMNGVTTALLGGIGFHSSVATTLAGTGTLTLGNGATITVEGGNHTISTGVTVALGNNTTITVNGGLTCSGTITGSGVVKEGGGTLTLNKLNNTYSGGTTVNAGSLFGIAGTGAGGTIYPFGSGTLSVNSGATVTVDNSSAGNYNYYGGGAISGTGNIIFIGNGVNRLMVNSVSFSDFTGTITIGGSGQPVQLDGANTTATLSVSSGAVLRTWTIHGQPTFGALTGGGVIEPVSGTGAMTIGNGNSNGTFTGVIQGAIGLTKSGAGTQVLSGLNSYSGKTTINGGTLAIGGSGYVGGGSYEGTITISASSFFAYNSSQSQTLSGMITGSGTLVIGAGTVNVTGNANNISGPTTVSGGTLKVNNTSGSATGTGSVTLSGGTLGGTGTISGLVAVNSGASIAPGNSTGTINVGALTLDSGGALNFEINSTSDHDLINVLNAGGFTLNGGTLTINGGAGYFSTVGSYTLVQYDGAIQGAGTLTLNSANADPERIYTFSTSVNPGYLTLVVAGATRGTIISVR